MKLRLLLFFVLLAGLVNAQQPELDVRARSKYSKEDLASMSVAKIEQINFYYRQSFVINKKDKVCSTCPEIDVNSIDISKFESRRHQDKRVVVFLTEPGYPIQLLSISELQEAYSKILQNHKSGK